MDVRQGRGEGLGEGKHWMEMEFANLVVTGVNMERKDFINIYVQEKLWGWWFHQRERKICSVMGGLTWRNQWGKICSPFPYNKIDEKIWKGILLYRHLNLSYSWSQSSGTSIYVFWPHSNFWKKGCKLYQRQKVQNSSIHRVNPY